ncbi:MAG: protein-glutamate O-methyltransferase [Cytophagales bacterium]|nr:protein-glutamate O-methyltransferase [Cytophagales bacterium]
MIKLSQGDFERLSSYVYQQCGINLTPPKRVLLEGRLQKRLQSLQMKSFMEYYKHVKSVAGRGELVHMLDSVSTNKTDFFREPGHFNLLRDHILPGFKGMNVNRPLRIWSAACSTGEEPYTTAMVLQDAVEKLGSINYEILATDISSKVLKHAANAVYREDRIGDIPMGFRKKYLLKSKDPNQGLVRIIPALRKKVRFQRMNLMDNEYLSQIKIPQDLVFCRNVLIYFDKPTQQNVVRRLVECLSPGGYLFIGHSESLFEMDLPLKQLMPATFQKLA